MKLWLDHCMTCPYVNKFNIVQVSIEKNDTHSRLTEFELLRTNAQVIGLMIRELLCERMRIRQLQKTVNSSCTEIQD